MNKKPVCVCVPQRHNSASSGPGSEIVLSAAAVVIVQVEVAVVPVWVMKNVVLKVVILNLPYFHCIQTAVLMEAFSV